jgi:hypothetical protein
MTHPSGTPPRAAGCDDCTTNRSGQSSGGSKAVRRSAGTGTLYNTKQCSGINVPVRVAAAAAGAAGARVVTGVGGEEVALEGEVVWEVVEVVRPKNA